MDVQFQGLDLLMWWPLAASFAGALMQQAASRLVYGGGSRWLVFAIAFCASLLWLSSFWLGRSEFTVVQFAAGNAAAIAIAARLGRIAVYRRWPFLRVEWRPGLTGRAGQAAERSEASDG